MDIDKIELYMAIKELTYSQILEVSKQTGVPVNKVSDMLWLLAKEGAIENNELLRRVGVSSNALNQVKKVLVSQLKPSSPQTELKEDARGNIGYIYGDEFATEETLLTILKGEVFQKSVELLGKYQDRRPIPERKYDQFTATVETTSRRAALLNFLGDVREKRLLFLGDDDFTSVAVAALKTAAKISVLDIDDRILAEISRMSQELGLNIVTTHYDARKPIHLDLKGQFDVVFTDPPYTLGGIKLFVSRAVEALDKQNLTARIYACYGNSDRAKERYLPVQEVFTDAGLMLRWVFDRFNRYDGAESIGSSSSLIIAEVTPKTRPLIKGNYDKPIYTND